MSVKSSAKLKSIVYISLSIALVAVCTMIIKIPSIRGGYINFGDIMIFITAVFLGRTAGLIAGGVGSAMADLMLGYPMYAPATLIIKALEGFFCSMIAGKVKKGETNFPRLIIALIIPAGWMVLGYFLYEYQIGGLLFANQDFGTTTALLNLPGNIIQGLVSAAAALPFILAIKKTGISFNLNN